MRKMKYNTILATVFLALFLTGSWVLLGPLRGSVPIYFGKNPVVHVLILLGGCLYLFLFTTNPKLARRCTKESMKTLTKMFVFILAALFIAGATLTLVPKKTLAGYLGEQAGPLAVLLGVGIGSVLPACPFVSYPVIAGVWAAGAGFPVISPAT